MTFLLMGAFHPPLDAQERTTLKPQMIRLRGGEAQDVYLDLGADSRQDIVLEARLVSDGRWPSRQGIRINIVRNASEERVQETVLRHTPGGRILWLEVLVERCATPGVYPVAVEVLTRGSGTGEPSRSAKIPLRIEIIGRPLCWTGFTGPFLLAFPIGLLMFFGWTSIAHSRFLTVHQLSETFRPCRWQEGGGTEPIERSGTAVRQRIAMQFRFVDRAKAWLLANPFVFGLPLQTYEETVEVLPGSRVETFSLVPQAVKRKFLEKNPHRAKGRLFVSATRGLGPVVFGLPDEHGRVGGLLPSKELDRDQVRSFGSFELRNSSPADAVPGKPSGWRILQDRKRKGSRGTGDRKR